MKIFFCLSFFFISVLAFGQNILFDAQFNSDIPGSMILENLDENVPFSSLIEFSSNDAWIHTYDPDNTSNGVAATTSYFMEPDTANRWLITPQISLGSFGNYLHWKAKSHDPSFPDDYLVLISTTDNHPSSFIDTIGFVQEENFEWTTREVNLSEYGYNDSTIYVAFVLRTFDGFKLYLDDIIIESENDLAIDENFINRAYLYPNPASDKLYIRVTENINDILIYNMMGAIVLKTNETVIDISSLIRGKYIIHMIYEDRIINELLIKD